jgi:hypothetical protein
LYLNGPVNKDDYSYQAYFIFNLRLKNSGHEAVETPVRVKDLPTLFESEQIDTFEEFELLEKVCFTENHINQLVSDAYVQRLNRYSDILVCKFSSLKSQMRRIE